ncbi:hypothetical protein [Xenorhabdus innexi]|uniref:Uncharacterized protein n=1 Tax=Xenorhabdus innexi TaxID=290109 RepID=A0A1N6MZ24_9GAMM|nr:hypothetical protein [Xenorhabdus innexi]PHM31230.1 hypothetical protein Xinn_02939 [Xenorhabdus innexi]SIP74024.1 hypothetical protein XIS1_490021 [Xenorhabdus innexi]
MLNNEKEPISTSNSDLDNKVLSINLRTVKIRRIIINMREEGENENNASILCQEQHTESKAKYFCKLARPDDSINGLGVYKMLLIAKLKRWDIVINVDSNNYILNAYLSKKN